MQPLVVIVHVAGRNHREPGSIGDVAQPSAEPEVAADRISLEFDKEPLASERAPATFGEPSRGSDTFPDENSRQQSVAATGQYDQALVSLLERGEVEPRVPAIFPAEMSLGDQAAKVGVSGGCL